MPSSEVMKKWATPPSGQTLFLFGATLNTASRELLLQVIEWFFAKQGRRLKDDEDHYKKLSNELLVAMKKLEDVQNAK